ncbi:MAG: hypothetical protein C0593_13150 [Marinilabiliales bacterium]|nr:MAG: hypothetical protein C0593_13150 [Marinilabiliales bacterium]
MQSLKKIFHLYIQSNTFQKGAALGYFAVFALIPIAIIIISVLGIFFGSGTVSSEFFSQFKELLGSEAAHQIQTIINNHHTSHKSILTTITGIIMLIVSASKIVIQLHNAFNDIYSIKIKPKNGLILFLKRKAFALIILVILFTILVLSTTISTFLQRFTPEITGSNQLLQILEHLFSFAITALIFSLMYKTLGDAVIHWKPAMIGGIVTAILFLIGKVIIAQIIAQSHIETTFGQASVLALIMLWVFYLSQIIFLGACFVKVIGDAIYKPVRPSSEAVRVLHKEVSES